MSQKSYAEKVKDAEVMSAGLQDNLQRAESCGLDTVFITDLRNNLQEVININNKQEKLKADLKQQTASLVAKMGELDKKVAKARKIVKAEFAQEQWRAFGIEAKR